MTLVALKDYGFTYAGSHKPALEQITFDIKPGEFILLCGASGSGKSTLLRQLKPIMAPAGESTGSLYYQDGNLQQLDPLRQVQEIGLVMAEVDQQSVMEKVWQELAFPLENIGLPSSEIRTRMAELAGFFGLTPLLEKSIAQLSGGWRQIINLASVLMMRPGLLLLDEPLSQLDPVMSRDFLQMLATLHQDLAMTIVVVEHQLEAVLPLAERVIVLQDGRIALDADAQGACRYFAQTPNLNDYLPPLVQVSQRSQSIAETVPLTVRQGRAWASGYRWEMAEPQDEKIPVADEVLLRAKAVSFRYERFGDDVIKHLELTVHKGEKVAILGGNGVGKSTLLKVLFGALVPQRGKVFLKGKPLQSYTIAQLADHIGYLSQEPSQYFLYATVAEEIAYQRQRLEAAENDAYIEQLLTLFALKGLEKSHPYDLSGGEKQRLALFLICSRKPQILLLDEPTKGLDPIGKKKLAHLLHHLSRQGIAVVIVTHDLEFAANYGYHCGMLFQGELSEKMPSEQFFVGKHFYTTTIHKVFSQWLPHAVTATDVQVVPHG